MSRQKDNFSSGSPIVDQMYGMEITGNVIPLNWFKTITTSNGKPNSTAIMLLSDIVYWYRPKILRDEATGEFIGIKKRFKADLLQRSYRQFSEQFGYSKRQVTEAIKALETLGVIRREFRTVSTNMQKLSNVLYIELFPDKLMELTYPEKAGSDVSLSNVIPITLKKERPSSQVKDRFRKLNIEHIKYVLDELSRCKSDVAHMRSFLITLMYNAPATIDSYYTAKVNHDMMHAEKQ